jgi:predicted N-formylglutamate amidohydrolase
VLDRSEPPPFEVINHDGSAPLLIACDHAANRIPVSLCGLGLAREHLEKHIAYDIGAKQVSTRLAEMFDAPLLSAAYSRLVIDLNRHLDDASLVVDNSDNVVIPGNQGLSDVDMTRRIDQFFHPYHNQYAEMAGRLAQSHPRSLILSVHSFTPTYEGRSRPWHYGVLWEESHCDVARAVMSNFAKIDDLVVGDNKPYHASDPQGYAQVIHAAQKGLKMILIEIRQDLVTDPQGQAQTAETIFKVVSPLVGASL